MHWFPRGANTVKDVSSVEKEEEKSMKTVVQAIAGSYVANRGRLRSYSQLIVKPGSYISLMSKTSVSRIRGAFWIVYHVYRHGSICATCMLALCSVVL